MANAYVEIKFFDIPNGGDNFEITVLSNSVNQTSLALEYTISDVNGFDTIQEAIAFTVSYLQSNYNVTNTYNIVPDYTNNTIQIIDNTGTISFSLNEIDSDGRFTVDIYNETITPPIKITDISLSENAINPCNLYDLVVTTTSQATSITQPRNEVVNSNPFTITGVTRNNIGYTTLEVTNGETTDILINIFVPQLLQQNLSVEINRNFNQTSSITVKYNVFRAFPEYYYLEYSLNNVDFFTTNSFTGLTDGNYTMYVRDNIGCSTSINFEITEEELNVFERKPIFNVNLQNSLISVRRNEKYKNPLNSLSYENEGVNRCDFKQLLQQNDGILTQQYNSTYNSVEITLHNCKTGQSNIIVPTQKTDNYNITDVRDATPIRVTYLGQSYVALKYVSGKTYDNITLTENGSYYLGSLVPEFMNTGDGVVIQGFSTLRVQDVIFVDDVQVLVLDILMRDFDAGLEDYPTKVISKYNAEDYNVFEYDLDLSTLNGDYYITYKATDTEFETIEEQTEIFNVSEEQVFTYVLNYYNSERNEMLYSTGIQNTLRIPYPIQLEAAPSEEQDVFNTDTNTVNIESTYRDRFRLYTDEIPYSFVRKIGIALTNDRLFINGLSVVKSEEMEIEPITGSNLYRINVLLTVADYVQNNTQRSGSVILPSGQPLDTNINGSGLLLV